MGQDAALSTHTGLVEALNTPIGLHTTHGKGSYEATQNSTGVLKSLRRTGYTHAHTHTLFNLIFSLSAILLPCRTATSDPLTSLHLLPLPLLLLILPLSRGSRMKYLLSHFFLYAWSVLPHLLLLLSLSSSSPSFPYYSSSYFFGRSSSSSPFLLNPFHFLAPSLSFPPLHPLSLSSSSSSLPLHHFLLVNLPSFSPSLFPSPLPPYHPLPIWRSLKVTFKDLTSSTFEH